MIRGDLGEVYFLWLPNIFQGTAFEKHTPMLTEEKQIIEKSERFSFCHLPRIVKKNSTNILEMLTFT